VTENTAQVEAPKTPADASARLATLQADKTFTDRLLAGGIAERKEWDSLLSLASSGDKVDAAVSMPGGVANSVPDSELRQLASTAADLRELGLPDEVVRQALSGAPVSAEEYRAVRQWRDERTSDGEWSKKFLAGDALAKKQMTIANIIISGGIKESAQ
jgi:hypothetical protein